MLMCNKKVLQEKKEDIREGNGNPLQYSCLENPMDRGAWEATVHGVAKSRTRLSDFTSLKDFILTNYFAKILFPKQMTGAWGFNTNLGGTIQPLHDALKRRLHDIVNRILSRTFTWAKSIFPH